jgi:hypothetical protein
VTEHVPPASVQVVALNEPVLVLLQVIVPVGVPVVPPLVSLTVTEQVVAVPTMRLPGVHVTPVALDRLTTRSIESLLPTWPGAGVVSPAHVAVSVCVPATVGVYVTCTEQAALEPLPVRVQVVLLKVPAKLLVQVTVPVGVFFAPELVSVTVAVHVTFVLMVSVVAEQVTVVELARWTDRLSVPLLVAWVLSPP